MRMSEKHEMRQGFPFPALSIFVGGGLATLIPTLGAQTMLPFDP